ncbi:MAG TPA: HNH endonuclease signature motif containing protein [Mycobacteriales bacterium]|jgi:hypothetical protein|nr:HNH endonuclease signature motif containing protein [Mycobacteriales bacterium]
MCSIEVAREIGATPGARGIGVLARLQLDALDDAALLEVLGMLEAQAGWLASVQNRALCALRDRAAAHRPTASSTSPGGPDDDKHWEREELRLAQRLGEYDARHRIETAVALRDRLPSSAAALAAGRISWRHADAIATETAALDPARAGAVERLVLADRRAVTVAQTRRAARRATAALAPEQATVTAADAADARFARGWDTGEGTGWFEAQLTAEGLATVTTALEDLATPATLHGHPLDPAALRRLSCDSTLTRLITDPTTGTVIDLGTTTRLPDTRLRRAIELRDGHRCTFPGCDRQGHLHAHHLRHWADGGTTDQDNLTLLCHRHHTAIHDAGWHAHRTRSGDLTWQSPAGQRHTAPVAVASSRSDPAGPDASGIWHRGDP